MGTAHPGTLGHVVSVNRGITLTAKFSEFRSVLDMPSISWLLGKTTLEQENCDYLSSENCPTYWFIKSR